MANILRNRLHTGHISTSQQQHEFLTTETEQVVRPPGTVEHQFGKLDQHLIANVMAIAVINLLKMIQIQHDQPETHTSLTLRTHGLFQLCFHHPPIMGASERIPSRQLFKLYALAFRTLGKDKGTETNDQAGSYKGPAVDTRSKGIIIKGQNCNR